MSENFDYASENFDYVEGDLIQMAKGGYFDVVFHGANCMNTMGSGVALKLREAWPAIYTQADSNTVCGDPSKLGTFSYQIVQNDSNNQKFVIANLYTQYGYGDWPEGVEKPRFSITALYYALSALVDEFSDPTLRFGFPQIGAGLGGGDWNAIEKVIDEVFYKRPKFDDLPGFYLERPKCVVLPS